MTLSREQSQALDRKVIADGGVPGVVLMENAGRGAAELLLRLGVKGTDFLCCGKGNNGGDGFVIARWLDNAGVGVRVLLFARPEDLTDDAAIMYRILERSGPPIKILGSSDIDETSLRRELETAEWVVDALFGSGLQGPVRPPFDKIIAAINASGARVLAVDIPSGLDADTGQPQGPTIRAYHTATIVAAKKGFAQSEAAAWLGQVHVIDMGAPRRLVEETIKPTFPR
jgi:NAD(P)H-hydrate epimerase